jgi:putative ABC transport system permease protein
VSARPEAPPRLARRALAALLGKDDSGTALAELDEGFRARVERDGPGAARRWYWRQAAGFALRFPGLRRLTARERTLALVLEDWARDVRWALRGLRRRPSYMAVAVLTLAVGIGANSAVFTLVSAHFLTPLPYDRPEGLALVMETQRGTMNLSTVAPGNYFAWREHATSFSDIAAFNVDNATVSDGDGAAERVVASVVTPNFFDVLGARPLVGDVFAEESVRPTDGRVVILGHALWVRRFGADVSVVGRSIRVDGRSYQVVGVMPPTFRQPERDLTWQRPELWRPLQLEEQRSTFGGRYLRTVARLAPDSNMESAQREIDDVASRLAQIHPENEGRRVLVEPLTGYVLGASRPTLLVLLGAGVAVFLLVCANVANLTLARGDERRREFALRAALGSGHPRLLRQLLLEGILLALGGAALGAALVNLADGLIQSVQARFFSGLIDVRVDARVVAFTALAALLAGVLSGLPVASAARRTDVTRSLRGGERDGSGPSAGRTRSLLVVGQVGLATALATVAALLIRSFNELIHVDTGFQAARVMTFTAAAPPDRDDGDGGRYFRQYFREVYDGVAALPGVERVALVSDLPFTTENRWNELVIAGRPPAVPEGLPRAEYHAVIPEYFDVMGIPLLTGRNLERAWEAEHPVPVLINQEMADRFWPAGDALGASFNMAGDTLQLVVVGVVGSELDDGYHAQPDPVFYMPYGARVQRQMAFVVRVGGDPAEVAEGIRAAVARVDPDVPAYGLRMMDDLLAETVVRPRAASLIGGAFALLALVIAAAGIYGVLSYTVQSRTREIGIRAALGASRPQLVSMVLGESGRLIVLGLALGWVGALLGGRAVSGILFGVRVWDPLSLVAASVLLGGAGALASWVPARRAVRVDPRDALRAD